MPVPLSVPLPMAVVMLATPPDCRVCAWANWEIETLYAPAKALVVALAEKILESLTEALIF